MSDKTQADLDIWAAYEVLVKANHAADVEAGLRKPFDIPFSQSERAEEIAFWKEREVQALNARIAELKVEAALHGDWKQVELCELALSYPRLTMATCVDRMKARRAARAACVEVLRAAEAQIDDDGQLALFAE